MPSALSLLLVEDSEADAELLLRELRRRGFEVRPRRVDTADDLEAALVTGSWDIVISDHNMPTFDGAEALRIVRRVSPDLPFVVVSGMLGEEHAVEAMRSGASDFVLKSKLDRLAPVIERELRDAEQRAEQRRTAAALAEAQRQFQHVQKLEAIGRLAGGIAHDFNNLLTAILGYADLVLAGLDADDARRADLAEIKHAGMRAADLTRQLLAFSRQQVLDPVVLDLGEVVEDAVRLLRRVIGEDVVLDTRGQPGLWPIRADRTQMVQILMNLAVNARDAMPHGGMLAITISNRTVGSTPGEPASPGDYVVLQVRDTGEGIRPELHGKIFEPFFTTKAASKGTGLGLSTVYGIVEQSSGVIAVDSAPGRGATFTVLFPRTEADEPAVAAPTRAPLRAAGEMVLVVEDETSLRELAARVLGQAGYQVLTASGPYAALQTATGHEGAIHLLLTDIVMPGMSGRELGERLLASRRDLRVLYMSGFTGDMAEPTAPVDSADIVLKPFTPNTLIVRVRDALSRPPRPR